MIIKKFWEWYEKNYTFNTGVAASLFLLQVTHLLWLFGEVVTAKILGTALFSFHGMPKTVMLLVDYSEIPALFATSFVYINDLRKGFAWKNLAFLLFLNSQWLHIFWITDEFVIKTALSGSSMVSMPLWLSWIAILIDYLELPIIYDTIRKFVSSLKQDRKLAVALAELKEKEEE